LAHPEVDEEAVFDKKARAIVALLVREKDRSDVGNFYVESEMKLNLIKYFNALFWIKPEWLLIGEAPGIHGCVKTGIPFTSERLIRQGHLNRHFPGTRFVVEGNKAEASATVVWGSVTSLRNLPPCGTRSHCILRTKTGATDRLRPPRLSGEWIHCKR
jgi:uracil-DNA glycosylase